MIAPLTPGKAAAFLWIASHPDGVLDRRRAAAGSNRRILNVSSLQNPEWLVAALGEIGEDPGALLYRKGGGDRARGESKSTHGTKFFIEALCTVSNCGSHYENVFTYWDPVSSLLRSYYNQPMDCYETRVEQCWLAEAPHPIHQRRSYQKDRGRLARIDANQLLFLGHRNQPLGNIPLVARPGHRQVCRAAQSFHLLSKPSKTVQMYLKTASRFYFSRYQL